MSACLTNPAVLTGSQRRFNLLEGSAHFALAHGTGTPADWSSVHIAAAIASFQKAAGEASAADAADHTAQASLKLARLCNELLQVGAVLHGPILGQKACDPPAYKWVSVSDPWALPNSMNGNVCRCLASNAVGLA